ncbi:unnamed protein product [Ilex paraguariensis]|uniref:Uncharacterized protein n=1 Tax=Ilex paraguariensis TaxID=185542 RepID=A0ABC8UWX1_9AQUA
MAGKCILSVAAPVAQMTMKMDYNGSTIVFSDAWWIGRKDENPEEVRLEFPKELNVVSIPGKPEGYDFKGGAGATCERKQGFSKPGMTCTEPESPKTESEDDLSDSQNKLKDLTEVTPTRHSARTAGKTFNFAESFSGNDSVENDSGTSEGEEQEVGLEHQARNHTPGNILILLS